MSTADLDLFGPPEAQADAYPRFSTVLRGFDPDQVREYVAQLLTRIDELETELREAEVDRDAARRRYAAARQDAYAQVAGQLADLLRAADQQADKLRREAEEDAARQVTEARQLAEQIQREAEDEADRLRREGEEALRQARAETERILGGLTSRREQLLADLQSTRDHLGTIVHQLDGAIATDGDPQEVDVEAPVEGPTEAGKLPTDLRPDDLLDLSEGFDLVLPDFLKMEDRPEEGST
jgi:cell division septum initiation protein DivIVA